VERREIFVAAAATLAAGLVGCAGASSSTGKFARAPGLPLPSGPVHKIAFGSCIDQNRPQPIWNAILADAPDLFIFGGDNVYASTPPWSRDRLEQAYAALGASVGFARLRARVPHLEIWDDHDYGVNDGGVEFPHKQPSKEAFLAFWELPPEDPRRTREGLYHAVRMGPAGREVQVILLDARWFRSALRPTDQRQAPGKERYLPDADPTKTMLGEQQWRWLEQQLRQRADLRLIVSGVQVLAEGHGWECWGNLPRERARLVELVHQTGAGGVVFLSGDRHIGAFYRHQVPGRYPLFEMTSSGMTHAWADAAEAGPNRLGDLVRSNHFGSIEIDWETRRVWLALKDEAGATRQAHHISLAELSKP
jgi:alkaline phosphatase D